MFDFQYYFIYTAKKRRSQEKETYSKFKVLVIDDKSVISECLVNSGFKVTHTTETQTDIVKVIADCDVVVCNLPFVSDRPFLIDKLCDNSGKCVVYPMCFGWGIVITVLRPGGDRIDRLSKDYKDFYSNVAQRVMEYGEYVRTPYHWLESYLTNNYTKPMVATDYLAAAMCANLISRLAEEREIKFFPKFYVSS